MSKFEISADAPGRVIEVNFRHGGTRTRKSDGKCLHHRLDVDKLFTFLECRDCGERINPIQWLAECTEFYDGLRYERKRYNEARIAYEAKKRCRCEHCGKLTNVRPASAADVREFKRGIKLDDIKDRL